ncbi:MAG: hypothetical protein QM790_09180 [Nibricoccus sp.]
MKKFASLLRMRLQSTVAVAGGLFLCWRCEGKWPWLVVAVLVVLAGVAWIAPSRYIPIQRLLDAIVRAITAAVSWTLLGMVYFCVFVPIRLLINLAGRDPLGVEMLAGEKSYLRQIRPAAADRFKRQF